ncbi:MAG: AAA family ATPase [Aphanothece saxicola GSE-SYN-MK-01-06B]|nr:AAA family ATPase [Aphanothece saxicola GSE-SYN-MK-01-06B]
MSSLLRRIQVNNLYGSSKCIDARVEDNTLILVGENGSGKTTFLRIIYNILAGRWRSLAMFRFDSAILTFDDDEIEITSSIIAQQRKLSSKRLMRFPSAVRQAMLEALDTELPPKESLGRISEKYGIPLRFLVEELSSFEEDSNLFSQDARKKLKAISDRVNAQILYLPTYRRIERELASIVDWIDPTDLVKSRRRNRSARLERTNSYIELVEFGMQDVEESRKTELDRLEKFQSENLNVLTLKHFGDIVSSAYQIDDIKRLATISESEINSALARVDESIVGIAQRNDWLKAIKAARSTEAPTERDQIICHYFLKIFDFQKRLQSEEERITSFCRVCSEYITDKDFVYDSTSFRLSIRPRFDSYNEDSVDLSDLSSGEKQIVSLFSHLYLSGQDRYFVLIDEPELSLSVPWQKRFLVDIHSGSFCAGLIAVTHSPFIYDNNLKKYAHSLGEFTV